MPVATTVKDAVCPETTVFAVGWVVIVGAMAAITVKAAFDEVTVPALFATTTLNCAPLSAATVTGVTYVADVAPAMLIPPLRHW